MSARPGPSSTQTLGYCLRCGGYGRGDYAGSINSHSDAISNHTRCPGPRPAQGDRRRKPAQT